MSRLPMTQHGPHRHTADCWHQQRHCPCRRRPGRHASCGGMSLWPPLAHKMPIRFTIVHLAGIESATLLHCTTDRPPSQHQLRFRSNVFEQLEFSDRELQLCALLAARFILESSAECFLRIALDNSWQMPAVFRPPVPRHAPTGDLSATCSDWHAAGMPVNDADCSGVAVEGQFTAPVCANLAPPPVRGLRDRYGTGTEQLYIPWYR